MIDFIIIAENLRKHRKLAGYTQEQIAEKVDVSVGYISKLETTSKSPSLSLLNRFSNIYGVDMSVFITGVDPAIESYRIPELYGIVKNFEPETKLLVINAALSFIEFDAALKNSREEEKA